MYLADIFLETRIWGSIGNALTMLTIFDYIFKNTLAQ